MVLRPIRFGYALRHRHYLSICLHKLDLYHAIPSLYPQLLLTSLCFSCTIPSLLFTFLKHLLNFAGWSAAWLVNYKEWGTEMKCTNLSVGLMCSRPVQPGRDSLKDPEIVNIFKCPPRACARGNQCLQYRSGPVCGTCLPGHVMTSSGCRPTGICPAHMFWWRLGTLAVVVPIVFIVYVHFAWRSVVPELGWLAGAILNRISTCMSALITPLLCFRAQDRETANENDNGVVTFIFRGLLLAFAMVEDLKSRSQEFHVPQYLKILVSSFLSHCNFTELKLHKFGLQS